MKNSANGNMYEVTLEETWELFGSYLNGAKAGLVCIVSEKPLSAEAKSALENSAAALGYGRAGCTFATLADADNKTALDAQALFLLIEGLDPLVVVATDAEAARSLGGAYRQDVPLDAPFRLFGRSAVAFAAFESLLENAQSKQVAWALLKKLPKFGER